MFKFPKFRVRVPKFPFKLVRADEWDDLLDQIECLRSDIANVEYDTVQAMKAAEDAQYAADDAQSTATEALDRVSDLENA